MAYSWTFNRTSLESKRMTMTQEIALIAPCATFNRTSLESKLDVFLSEQPCTEYRLLIEPVWNRNSWINRI